MKTLKINKLILSLIGLVAFNSCVEDDDFSIPNTAVVEPTFDEEDEIIPISSVNGDLAQQQSADDGIFPAQPLDYSNDESIYTFPTDGSVIFVEGYVVSSDEGGNYFEELIIQDAPSNPTFGLRVLVDVNPLFVRYEVGRKIFVKLNGLSVAISNGVVTVGPVDGDRIGKIAASQENDFIIRDTEVATITPLPLTISEFTEEKTNLMIELQDVQFSSTELGKSFAAEQEDQFDGERFLDSCGTSSTDPCEALLGGGKSIVSTSTFSDFKGLTLPSGRGNMIAILSRNFFGENFNIVINSPEDIDFNSTERCGFSCDGDTSTVFTVFEEDFQSITNESQLDTMGWTNVNICGGNERYERSSFSGDIYMKISAFGTGETTLGAWLVTPAINLDSTTQEELSFEISSNFETGTALTVLITENFTGDITTTDWTNLNIAVPVGDDDGFGSFEAFTANISCLSGDVHVAFQYLGSDDGIETRYHVDDIKITGQN